MKENKIAIIPRITTHTIIAVDNKNVSGYYQALEILMTL